LFIERGRREKITRPFVKKITMAKIKTNIIVIAAITAMLQRFDNLTDEDKAQIKQMCKDAGLEVSLNKRCKDCYKDALLLLKVHYGVSLPSTDIVTPSGNFVYHNGLKKVVWWWRHHYYELSAQTDDATIEKYMALHPSQTHFSRVEPESTEPTTEETSTVGDNGAESGENIDGGTAEQPTGESPSTDENAENNEGENVEGDKAKGGE
jgi:hypothetical protein